MLYFDHCATTRPYDEVIDAVAEVMKEHYGNPSSIHRMGAQAEKLLMRARDVIGESLGVSAGQILFTSGGTESNNLAIRGAAMQYRSRGNHMITTAVEHASVYECFKQLEREGFRVTYVPVNASGHVDVRDIEAALTEDTILVSVMHVNNEVGSVQPIAEIGALLKHRPKVLFHVDGVQSIGKVTVDLKGWGIDLFSISAHKIRGPKGAGALYCRDGVKLQPLLAGGTQEFGMRAGTQNVPNLVGMAKAVRMTLEGQSNKERRLYAMRAKLLNAIRAIPQLVVNGSEDERTMAPHIVHFSYPGMKPEVFIHMLEKHKIIASTQSACSSKTNKPSRVLLAMTNEERRADSGIRISMSVDQEEHEVDFLCRMLPQVVNKLKPLERSNE